MKSFTSVMLSKFSQMAISIVVFFLVLFVVFAIAGKVKGRLAKPVALLIFLVPAIALLMTGLVVPAIRTFYFSTLDANSLKSVGLENYKWAFTDPGMRQVLVNTALWTVITPIVTTCLGLLLAIMLDRIKRESVPKSIIFMPMAISFVGASIIFKFMFEYRDPTEPQIGLLSALVKTIGFEPSNWLLVKPLNTFLLMMNDQTQQ